MKAFNPKTDKMELMVEAIHVTNDMGIENCYINKWLYNADTIQTGDVMALDYDFSGAVKVISVADGKICMDWGGDEFCLAPGEFFHTKQYAVANPCIRDSLSIRVSYHQVPDHRELTNMIIEVSNADRNTGDFETNWMKEYIVKHFVDFDIERGYTGMWVAKALLESCSNWKTMEIFHWARFRHFLLKGVEAGALQPANRIGWEWMEIAARNNDPEKFMEDIDRYYDILADAHEHGITEATDIMNTIWEPENCQEED